MIISIDYYLQDLYNKLKSSGFEVHYFSENINSDVIIYSGANTHFSDLNASQSSAFGGGVFYINGDNKSVSELENMIEKRSYSSLF